jgi:predicted aspartyl protease
MDFDWKSIRDCIRLHNFYPHHRIWQYDAFGRPGVTTWVDNIRITGCLVDTGADETIMPFAHFRYAGYMLDMENPVRFETAEGARPVSAYELKRCDGRVIAIRLGDFTFRRPGKIYASNDVQENLLGRSLLGPYAFFFEEECFHLFARDM